MSTIYVEVGSGELLDKLTILEIKLAQIKDAGKLANIRYEFEILSKIRDQNLKNSNELKSLTAQLKAVNQELWAIEDDIRILEREKDFGDKFIALARAVYITNDKRALLKRDINALTNSSIIEEKSYAEF